ncbi:hypothetical protein DPMN_129477 [Dreissena polymorpha]|uniref:Uncharacterized protein n=1 Tax=Dreissena polymorpha TaxID=45954 RepID=A0A9D4JXE1_DREPO|nr:hypothetical protein DPMN_129477 [Dreissena polymorpha]
MKSSRCSCICYGIPCTAVCGPCQTENSDNPNNLQEVCTEDEEDDNDSFNGLAPRPMSWPKVIVHQVIVDS